MEWCLDVECNLRSRMERTVNRELFSEINEALGVNKKSFYGPG